MPYTLQIAQAPCEPHGCSISGTPWNVQNSNISVLCLIKCPDEIVKTPMRTGKHLFVGIKSGWCWVEIISRATRTFAIVREFWSNGRASQRRNRVQQPPQQPLHHGYNQGNRTLSVVKCRKPRTGYQYVQDPRAVPPQIAA